jgi:hypothetical protein
MAEAPHPLHGASGTTLHIPEVFQMSYATLLSTTARSAVRTARFCFRVSRIHSRKAWAWYHAAFLGAEAVARYEAIGRAVGVVGCIAIACWQTVQILVDAHVEAALEQPEAEQPLLPAVKPMLLLAPAPEPAPAPAEAKPKAKRGRPCKEAVATPVAPKRKPGRPRKTTPAPVGA